MSSAEALFEEALRLSPDDREWLAAALVGSIEKEPGYDEAWRAEIERRWQSVLDGTAKLYDEDEAEAFVFAPFDDE